jgi:hypothetical protein
VALPSGAACHSQGSSAARCGGRGLPARVRNSAMRGVERGTRLGRRKPAGTRRSNRGGTGVPPLPDLPPGRSVKTGRRRRKVAHRPTTMSGASPSHGRANCRLLNWRACCGRWGPAVSTAGPAAVPRSLQASNRRLCFLYLRFMVSHLDRCYTRTRIGKPPASASRRSSRLQGARAKGRQLGAGSPGQ